MKLGPYLYRLNTFNIPNNEGVNEWVGVEPKNHEIKRISTLASSKTSLENAKEMEIFSLPSIAI